MRDAFREAGDDILQNLKQQAQRGTRSSASYDPDASSNFGKTTASSDGTPNFESMRDAFREAGMEALETKSPVAAPPTVASADESIRVDFGQAAQRQSLAHQSIASVDGVMLQSRDGGVDAVAEEPQQPPTDETSVYSPPGAEEEKAPLATDATSVYSPPGASEAQPTVNTSADEFAALAAAQEDESESEQLEGDDAEDRQVDAALKPAKKEALERLVEQLQRDNDRLQASLQLAYERAEAAKGEWEAERESLVQKAKEAATEAKLAIASSKSPTKREPGELAKSAMDPRASRLAAELQLAKERDALRDEVNQLTTLRQKDQQTIKQLQRQPPTPPPPRAPPPEQRAFQDVERRCTDLERELEDQRAAHEYRIHALRDEFEKLRDAHERKLRAVKAEAQRKAPTLTENTVVGPKKAAGISRQALHAIEEQSRKDHEAKVKAEQKAERLQRDLEDAKQSLVRARNKLKASNAQLGSTETLASVSATSSPPPPRRSREKSPHKRRDEEASSLAPPPPAKRRGVDVGTQSPRRKHKDAEAPQQTRRGVDAGTQSPKPRTT